MSQQPVAWRFYEMSSSGVVRLHFSYGGPPVRTASRVVVRSRPEVLTIKIWLPRTASRLARYQGCVEIDLPEPLNGRRLVDAYTHSEGLLGRAGLPPSAAAGWAEIVDRPRRDPCTQIAPDFFVDSRDPLHSGG